MVEAFWPTIDPRHRPNAQFLRPRPAVPQRAFYAKNDEQKQILEASRQALADSGKTDKRDRLPRFLPQGEFYPAEDYTQDYYSKNPIR